MSRILCFLAGVWVGSGAAFVAGAWWASRNQTGDGLADAEVRRAVMRDLNRRAR